MYKTWLSRSELRSLACVGAGEPPHLLDFLYFAILQPPVAKLTMRWKKLSYTEDFSLIVRSYQGIKEIRIPKPAYRTGHSRQVKS